MSDCHPTNRLIHWTTRDKERETLSLKLRTAYDKIADAGLEEELEMLLDQAREAGMMDENDSNNPDL